MKKLLALLLALVMVFSLVACNNDKDNDDDCKHKDKDGDGICDKCDADMDEDEDGGLTGSALAAAVMAQLETAKSLKADFTYELEAVAKNWTRWDDEGNEITPVQETQNMKAVINGSFVFTLNDNGGAMQINLTMTAETDGEQTTQEQNIYIIDGYAYTYNQYADAYEKEYIGDEVDMEEIEAMLGTALEGVDIQINEKDVAKVADQLLEPIIKGMSIEDGKGGSYTFKGKKLVNDFVAYINNVDVNTTKISKIVNDVLALVDKDLTVNSVLGEAERVLGLTVKQLVAELDTAINEEFETTLQGIYDEIVANENVLAIIENVLVAEGAGEEEIAEIMSQIKALKISDLLSQTGVENVVIWDLLASEMFGEGGPTKSDFFAQIKSILDLSVADFEDMIGDEIFSDIKDTIGTLAVDELEVSVDLKLNKNNSVNKVMYKGKAAFSVDTPWWYDETKRNEVDASMNYTVNIHSVSDKAVEVTLPAGAKIIENLPHADLYINDEYVGYVDVYMYGSQVEVYMYYYDYEVADINGSAYLSYDALNGYSISIPAGEFYNRATDTYNVAFTLTYQPEYDRWIAE